MNFEGAAGTPAHLAASRAYFNALQGIAGPLHSRTGDKGVDLMLDKSP
jgi:hypothetical protein